MKLPRDVSGKQLIKALATLGYKRTRQRGSHARVTTQCNGEHHEVIPLHSPIKPKTLSSILKNLATHHKISHKELINRLNL